MTLLALEWIAVLADVVEDEEGIEVSEAPETAGVLDLLLSVLDVIVVAVGIWDEDEDAGEGDAREAIVGKRGGRVLRRSGLLSSSSSPSARLRSGS